MPNYKKRSMTNWYSPSQLLDTAKKTIISTTVGQYADPRSEMPDLRTRTYRYFDYSKLLDDTDLDFKIKKPETERKEIWIDYAADVGDGFNPTYAIAHAMSQPTLSVDGVDKPLPRGEILFFGGDGVYPTANSGAYEHQLVEPYRMAFKAGIANGPSPLNSELANDPHVFALPGNHDWYDSLVAFKQLFCSHVFNARKFADGWTTRQRRSYFTLKLPNKWWLLAVDLQLNHNIDVPQLMYFERVIKDMEAGDKVILCVPEPYWEKAIKYQGVTDKYVEKERSIDQLDYYLKQQKVSVRAFIAGDLHHYRHFRDKHGVHKITAGGGGAFLHATHDYKFARTFDEVPKERQNDDSIWLEGEYPKHDVSKRMGWRDFGFLFHNWTFGLLTAGIYFALALLVRGKISDAKLRWQDPEFWYRAMEITVNRMIEEPLVILVVVLLMIGLIFFTDSESKTYKRWAGFIHGVAHLTATFILGWLAYALSVEISETGKISPSLDRATSDNVVWFLTLLVVTGVGGYIIGSFIMGIYLYVSLHVFGRHSNEAFSALKLEGYKNFLRMHIGEDGVLTIYPIKIERVPKKGEWIDAGEYYKPPEDSDPLLRPTLIEANPIDVR